MALAMCADIYICIYINFRNFYLFIYVWVCVLKCTSFRFSFAFFNARWICQRRKTYGRIWCAKTKYETWTRTREKIGLNWQNATTTSFVKWLKLLFATACEFVTFERRESEKEKKRAHREQVGMKMEHNSNIFNTFFFCQIMKIQRFELIYRV